MLRGKARLVDQSAGEPGLSLVVIDLSSVQLLHILGMGAIVQISNKCEARDQTLKLAAAPPAPRQIFAMTRLDRVLQLVDTVEAAVAGAA